MRSTRLPRTLTALAVGIVVLGITVAGFLAERGVQIPEFIPTCLHGVCPFGGVATIGRLLTGGLYVPRTGAANLFALAATLGTTLLAGAFFCGWLCPLGAVQEWVRRLGRRIGIFPKSTGVPFTGERALAVDRALGYLRYGTLLLILFLTYRGFNLVFAAVDPFYALFHFWTGAALPAALAVLGATLLLSLFVDRPWCRWFCPFGAVQGLVQKIAPWKVRRDPHRCVDCGACDRACPLNVAVSKRRAVTDGRCNRCLSCVAACPKPGALRLAPPRLLPSARACPVSGVPQRVHRLQIGDVRGIAALVLVGFLAPLAVGSVYRHVVAEGTSSIPGLVAAGQPAPGAAAVAISDRKPEELLQALSGSLSLAETAALIRIGPPALLEALGLPETFDLSVKLRDLEEHQPQKTYRWVRERIEALLREPDFTQASPGPRETSSRGGYPGSTHLVTGGLT